MSISVLSEFSTTVGESNPRVIVINGLFADSFSRSKLPLGILTATAIIVYVIASLTNEPDQSDTSVIGNGTAHLSNGQFAGIIIGVISFFVLVAGGILCYMFRVILSARIQRLFSRSRKNIWCYKGKDEIPVYNSLCQWANAKVEVGSSEVLLAGDMEVDAGSELSRRADCILGERSNT